MQYQFFFIKWKNISKNKVRKNKNMDTRAQYLNIDCGYWSKVLQSPFKCCSGVLGDSRICYLHLDYDAFMDLYYQNVNVVGVFVNQF